MRARWMKGASWLALGVVGAVMSEGCASPGRSDDDSNLDVVLVGDAADALGADGRDGATASDTGEDSGGVGPDGASDAAAVGADTSSSASSDVWAGDGSQGDGDLLGGGGDDVPVGDSNAAEVGPADVVSGDALPDGGAHDATVGVGADAADGLGGDGPITCGARGFAATSAGFHDLGASAGLAIFQAYDREFPPFGVLGIEIYDQALTGPGTVELLAWNYRDCEVCVRIRTGCEGQECPEAWLAEGGRLVISRWDTHFVGYLEGVSLRAVDIDPETFVSTPRDAAGWCLDRFDFSAQIEE